MIAGHDSEIQTGESVADIMLYRVASDVLVFYAPPCVCVVETAGTHATKMPF
jgi:hypothetical protein